jgi:hypothetical protein
MKASEDKLYQMCAESAEKEARAQLQILEVLRNLDRRGAQRVIGAVGHILEAELRVPGIVEILVRGFERRKVS